MVLLLGLLLAGVSSVWADYEEVYNLNCPKNSSNSAYASNYNVTIDGITWNAPGNQNIDGCWRIGGKSISDPTNRVITGKNAIEEEVTKITFNHNGKSRAAVTVPYVKLTVASDESFDTVIDEVVVEEPDITKGVANSFDFTPTSPLTKWDNCYYKITINVSNSDSSNGGLDVTSIVFYKTVADRTETVTTISATGITNTDLKDGTAAGSLSASVTAGDDVLTDATVSWESENEAVATIDAEGNVTLVGVGTATITATFDGDDTYKGSTGTYELTVTDSTPFTGGDVTFDATIDKGNTVAGEGTITKNGVTMTCSSGILGNGTEYRLYKNSETTFSTTIGTITKIEFTCKSGNPASGFAAQTGFTTSGNNGTWVGNAESVSFTASNKQVQATQIVVTVDMTNKEDPNFSFGETTTFTVNLNDDFTAPTLTFAEGFDGTVVYSSDNEDVALVDETTGEVLIGSVEGTATIIATSEATENFYAGSASYTINVVDSREEAGLVYATASQTVYVDETFVAPELTNPYELEVTFSSSNEDIATVDAEGNVTVVDVGSVTITATFAGDDSYKPGSASYTLTVKRPIPEGALFYEGMSGYTGSSDVTSSLSTTYDGLDSDNWNSFTKVYAGKVLSGDADGHLKFGSSSAVGKAVTKAIELTGSGMLTYKVQRYDSKNAGNLKISVTGATATGDVDVIGTAEWVEKTVYLTGATGSVVITFETTSDDPRIRVDDILVTAPATLTANITSAGYATWVPAMNVEVPTGVQAFIVSSVSESKAVLTELVAIPAGTPVVLKGGEDTYTFNACEEEDLDDVSGNLLQVSDGETAVGDNIYVLSNKNGIGFYRWSSNVSLSAGRVYLQIGDGARSVFYFDFNGQTTGIAEIEKTTVNENIFDLQGRRVSKATKGLYIVNGKKIIK